MTGARRIPARIDARTKRGALGRTWWSKEFVSAMEDVVDKGRLSRGRNYARTGHVLSMQLEPGRVVGEVQGSQLQPFTASVTVRTLDEDAREQVFERVRHAPGMLARMAAGILPEELGPLLLPTRAGELDFDCTCPDPTWPCKHVAAVALLFAEYVDENPLAVMTLRGLDLDVLTGRIGGDGAVGGPGEEGDAASEDFYGEETELPDLPSERFRPALEDLDPMLLRRALRSGGIDEAVVIRAFSDLEDLYRRLR